MKHLQLLLIFAINIAYTLAAGYVFKCHNTTDIKATPHGEVIGTLYEGDYIYSTEVLYNKALFYLGWVDVNDLTKMTADKNNYKVNASYLNFREGPSTNYRIFYAKPEGTPLIYYGRDRWTSEWCVTSFGYCNMNYLEPYEDNGDNGDIEININNGNNTLYEVLDVSRFNSINDFDSVAAGIDGVIIRVGNRYSTNGTLLIDPKLETHYNGFKGKTKIGFYFYTQATNEKEAEEEAVFTVDLIKDKTCDFPIYWDSENSPSGVGRADSLSKNERTNCAIAFINKIKELGYRACVYASDNWFKNNLDFNRILNSGASIWVARYSDVSPITSPYDMWQYTSSAEISGSSDKVDMSHVYNNIAGW